MSTRTIIEINHDFIHDLRRNPERFMELLTALSSCDATAALNKNDGKPVNWCGGIRLLGQRHHSETLKLKVE